MTRPLLFLDVDGVLNPFPDCPEGFTEYDFFPEDDEPVRLAPRHVDRLGELAAVFDVEKVPGITVLAGDRPAAWVDDNLGPEAWEWAEQREAPTLLVAVDSATGLTRPAVDELLEWAGGLRRP